MRQLQYLFYVIVLVTANACTKVIDIQVRDTEIKYVIEGVITNEPGDCHVYISQSKNFNEDNTFPPVTDARVTVTVNANTYELAQTVPGDYSTLLINGTPGQEYHLRVEVGGKVFTAVSRMPQQVKMDSLYVSRGPFGTFQFATIKYRDPAGINNGYRFIQYVNSVKEPTIYWDDDEFTDGEQVINQLDVPADEEDDPRYIKSGDEVTVEMLTIDEAMFTYWYTLRSEGGSGSAWTASPSNPVNNIDGDALGYFSAHTIDRRTIIAP